MCESKSVHLAYHTVLHFTIFKINPGSLLTLAFLKFAVAPTIKTMLWRCQNTTQFKH